MKAEQASTVRPGGYSPWLRLADQVAHLLRSRGAFQLSPGALQAAAAREAGRGDDHPEEIAEPLSLLCEDLAAHPPTELGAVMSFLNLKAALSRRILLQAALRGAPGRLRRPPIVLVGWYRTGTTFLQQLLGALPGYDFVPLHRLAEPVARFGSRARAALAIRWMRSVVPELRALHPVTADGPEECWLLLLTHLLVEGLAFHWHTPRFYAWLKRVDRRPAYQTWARAAALLEADLGHGLVLKDPAHLLALPEIVASLPEARLIWTHRDPLACIGSYGSLTAVQHRAMYGVYDSARAGQVCLDRMIRGIGCGLAAREKLPPGQLVDVPYAQLTRDPVGAVARICALAGLPFDRQAVTRRAAALKRPRPRHRYDLAQWGLTGEEVRARFPRYGREWWS